LVLVAVVAAVLAVGPGDGMAAESAAQVTFKTWGTRQTLRRDGHFRVATDGETTAVAGNGVVDIFTRSGSEWVLTQTVESPSGREHDLFGSMFDLDGDVMAVSQANWSEMEFSVQVFERLSGRWEHTAVLEDMEAFSLAVWHGVIAVSGFDLATPIDDHGVYLYEATGRGWERTGEIPSRGEVGCMPSSVDLWRNRLVTALTHGFDPCVPEVVVYRRHGGSWVMEQRLTMTEGEWSGGKSVAISNWTIAVGDPGQNHDPPTEREPKMRIFEWNGRQWSQTQVMKRFRHAFGGSVALHKDTLVVGDVFLGGAWVYTRVDGRFRFARRLPKGGFSVAVWGPIVLNGGPGVVTEREGQADAYRLVRCQGLVPTLVGTDEDDLLAGTLHGDVIFAAGGDDRVDARDGPDTVCAGAGDDTVTGGSGNDVLFAGGGNDLLHGNAGSDQLHGNSGPDTLSGGPGTDRLWGDAGDDVILGGTGNDFLYGGSGADTLRGGDGNDRLFGWIGNDGLYGGEGRDQLRGQQGDDLVDGGPAHDFCSQETVWLNCETSI
jgi:hypothetical protein